MLTLPRKNTLLTGEAVGQSLYMNLEVGWEGQMGTWEFGGNGVGVGVCGGENVNEQKVGKHIGEMVLRVGLWGGRSCQNRSRTPALS